MDCLAMESACDFLCGNCIFFLKISEKYKHIIAAAMKIKRYD